MKPEDGYKGAIPVRQGITVLPANTGNGELRLGWTIYEELGPIHFSESHWKDFSEEDKIKQINEYRWDEMKHIIRKELYETKEYNIEEIQEEVSKRLEATEEKDLPRYLSYNKDKFEYDEDGKIVKVISLREEV